MKKTSMPLFLGVTQEILNNEKSFLYVTNHGALRGPVISCKEKKEGIWNEEDFKCVNYYVLFDYITEYFSKEDCTDMVVFNGFTRAQIASYNNGYSRFLKLKEQESQKKENTIPNETTEKTKRKLKPFFKKTKHK